MDATPAPTFAQATRFWIKLGFINFGGPTGQIALMHRELVEKRKWISEERFLHALNYCTLLPGPEAMQLAIYIGWLLHRTAGGIVAGLFFFLPSVVALLALSYTYAAYGHVPLVAGVLWGLKAVVLAIVAHAALRIGRKALGAPLLIGVAAASFVALRYAQAPFPLVILGAGLLGLAAATWTPRLLPAKTASQAPEASIPAHQRPTWRRALVITAWGALLWLGPLALLTLGPRVYLDEGLYFSGAALITFGGAYAVLSYLAQTAVERYGWLTAPQMVDGLGLAETTPGPLIMVVAFVGYMAGWTHPGDLPPALAGALGLLVAVHFTFLPSFLFIFLGAPHIETLRHRPRITAVLATIMAAVVGIILHLTFYFGEHVLLPASTLDVAALTLAAAAFLVLILTPIDVAYVVLAGAVVGLGWRLVAA